MKHNVYFNTIYSEHKKSITRHNSVHKPLHTVNLRTKIYKTIGIEKNLSHLPLEQNRMLYPIPINGIYFFRNLTIKATAR